MLVHVTIQSGDLIRETLTSTCSNHELVSLVAILQRVSRDLVPVIEDQLREGLTGSVGAEIGSETWTGWEDEKR